MGKKTILLVEDDSLQAGVYKRVLEREGFTVEQAFDARSALEKLLQMGKLDCMILDVMLPVEGAFEEPMGGMEAGIKILESVRREERFGRWRNLPVICYTVRGLERDIRQELERYGAKVITKGGHPESLIEAVREVIKKTILLVEDDPLQANSLRRILISEGFAVEQAFDARSALEKLLQMGKLDCMVLDVMLPVEGAFEEPKGGMEAGIKILQLIRENVQYKRWHNIPVICFTVRGVDKRVKRELEALGGKVITKGDPPESLLNSLRQMIEE